MFEPTEVSLGTQVQWIDASQADGSKLGVSWRPTGLDSVGAIGEGWVIAPRREDGFFYVPTSLLDGTIPDPKPWGDHADWICEDDWDFLVYSYSNGRGESFAAQDAMRERVGIGSYDYYGRGKDTIEAVRNGMWQRLVNAGFAQSSGRERGSTPLYDLLVPPQVSPVGFSPSGVKATQTNLKNTGEPYVMIPRVVMTKNMWKQLRYHWLRRLLAAVYCFNDLPRHGGVDLDHLRLEDDRIGVSDAFVAATGGSDLVDIARGLDFLSSQCGLANWIPVSVGTATLRPGQARTVYQNDSDDGQVCVFRPTLQEKSAREQWMGRCG